MRNPFDFGRELGIGELVDRETEIASVLDTVRNGTKLFLIGPRRYGKTSILKAAEDVLATTDAVLLRFDAESYPSIDLLVGSVIAGAASQLKTGVERAGEQVRKFFSRLRPEIDFSLNDNTWTAKVSLGSAGDPDNISLLVEALNSLEALALTQPKQRAVGLVIDEFQKVIELGGREAESQIRAAIQRHKRTGYVFAGSKTKLLNAMTMDAARPFYRLGSVLFIGSVPRKAFEDFIEEKFRETRFKVQRPGVAYILDVAEEVPYNVQMLAHACWTNLRESNHGKGTLTKETVDNSVELLVRKYDPFYTQVWTGLTSIQQKTLIAVIEEKGTNLRSMKVIQKVGKGASTVQRSLGALLDKNILREDQKDGVIYMRFEDPFFAQWINRFAASF